MTSNPDLKAKYKAYYPKTLGVRLGYTFFICFNCILWLIPLSCWCLLGSFLGWIAWYLSPSYKARLIRNIRIITADQGLTRKEQIRLAHRSFQSNISNFLAAGKAAVMSDKSLRRHYSFNGREDILQALSIKKGTLCLIAHTGNWELLTRIRPEFPEAPRFGSMYRELDNPLIEAYWKKKRSKSGCEMFGKKTSSFSDSLEPLRDYGILGLLCDQHAGGQGTMIPFFGKVTSTINLPALIQRRTKSALVIATVQTVGIAKWVINMKKIPDPPHPSKDYTATTAYIANALEKAILRNIPDGFWLHNRWKPTVLVENQTALSYLDTDYARPRLPFRVLICTPIENEAAKACLPFIQKLFYMRSDAQITIICPHIQIEFWQQQTEIHSVQARPDHWKKALLTLQHQSGCDLDLIFAFDRCAESLHAALKLRPTLTLTFKDHPALCKGIWRKCQRSSPPNTPYTTEDYTIIAEEIGLAKQK